MNRTLRQIAPLVLAFAGSFLMAGSPAARGPVAPRDDEIVKEFKKYFKKFKDTPSRVSCVLDLEGTESAKVVDVLIPVLRDKEPDVVRAAVQVLAAFETGGPIERMWAVLEKNKDEAVRVGLLWAIADGGYAGGSEVLPACLEDKSWEVRRRAVNAIAAAREEGAGAAILPLCEDGEVAVRCAALDGLAKLREPGVVAHGIANLNHESWQVRASAVHALRDVRSRDSIEPLIERMALEEGRLVADIGEALAAITGRDFGQRIDGWQNFWKSYRDRFQIPTDAELRKLREAQKERAETYKPPGAVTYHGVETPSRSILFVIDVSGSMENLVIEKERFKDGDYPSYRRIDIVKTELQRTIENLEPYVKFNILAFATEVEMWKKTLVSAKLLNKTSAIDWAGKLDAIGGSSKEDLARAGLTGSANLEAGKTNTFGAPHGGPRRGRPGGQGQALRGDGRHDLLPLRRPAVDRQVRGHPRHPAGGARGERPAQGRDPHDRDRRVPKAIHGTAGGREWRGLRRSRALRAPPARELQGEE